jgi:hypothetical protein
MMRLTALSGLVPDPAEFRNCPPTRPLVSHMPPGPIQAMLGLGDVDKLLGRMPLNRRMVSVVSQGRRSAASTYTWADQPSQPGFAEVVRPDKLTGKLDEGATVVLESLHRTWPVIGDLCRRLSYECGLPVSANAYLTPKAAQGFAHHYDTHSVLIVQTAGSKTWQLHEPMLTDPLEHQPFRPEQLSEEDWTRLRTVTPALEVTLRPGDTLWIPRGWIHNGFATDEASLHLSLGFPALTAYWVANELVKRLDSSKELRAELPWGFARSSQVRQSAIEATIKSLTQALTELTSAEAADQLHDTYCQYFLEPAHRPVTVSIGLEVEMTTPVHTVAESVIDASRLPDGRLRLHLGNSILVLDAGGGTAVEQLLAADSVDPWSARDLVDHHPVAGLSGNDAVELVRTLLRAGVVRLAS